MRKQTLKSLKSETKINSLATQLHLNVPELQIQLSGTDPTLDQGMTRRSQKFAQTSANSSIEVAC